MRSGSLASLPLVLLMSTTASGQGWIEYTSTQDRFLINVPVQPTVRAITYSTEYGITLPARVTEASSAAAAVTDLGARKNQ